MKMKTNLLNHFCILFLFVVHPSNTFADPTLLWKMKFDSPIVKTSDLKEWEIGKVKAPDFPLKTVMAEKSIFILDNQGKVKNKYSLKGYSKTAMADNGMYFAGLKDGCFDIFTHQNEIISTITITNHHPVLLPQHIYFKLSPDGEYIVIVSWFAKSIYFYNTEGQLLSKYDTQGLKEATIRFSKDSNYVGVHVPNFDKKDSRGYLLYFKCNGELLWKFDHSEKIASFDVSTYGNKVAIASTSACHFLNSSGETLYRLDVKEKIPFLLKFAHNESQLFIFDKIKKSIICFDLFTKRNAWLKIIENFCFQTSQTCKLFIGKTGAIIFLHDLVLPDKRENINYLFLLNNSGNILWKKTNKSLNVNCRLFEMDNYLLIISDYYISLYNVRL